MANQQVYQAYPQNKGTLIPGQTISVNNYTVQVERYLSQGTPWPGYIATNLQYSHYRWFRPCVPRTNATACVQYDTPCPQTHRGCQRVNAHGCKEGSRYHGEHTFILNLMSLWNSYTKFRGCSKVIRISSTSSMQPGTNYLTTHLRCSSSWNSALVRDAISSSDTRLI